MNKLFKSLFLKRELFKHLCKIQKVLGIKEENDAGKKQHENILSLLQDFTQ